MAFRKLNIKFSFLNDHIEERFLSLFSDHSFNQLIDKSLSVTECTTILEWVSLLLNTSLWRAQLEWPQEVVSLLEVWANSDDFVDEIFNRDDAVFT